MNRPTQKGAATTHNASNLSEAGRSPGRDAPLFFQKQLSLATKSFKAKLILHKNFHYCGIGQTLLSLLIVALVAAAREPQRCERWIALSCALDVKSDIFMSSLFK